MSKYQQATALPRLAASNPDVALKIADGIIKRAGTGSNTVQTPARPSTTTPKIKLPRFNVKGALQNLRSMQLPNIVSERLTLLEEIVIASENVYVGDDPVKIQHFNKNYCDGATDDATKKNMRDVFKLVFSSTDDAGKLISNPLPPCDKTQRDVIIAGIDVRQRTLDTEIQGMGGVDSELLRKKKYQQELLYKLSARMKGDRCKNYISGTIGDVPDQDVNDDLKDLVRTFVFLMLQNIGSMKDYSDKDKLAKDIITKLKKNIISKDEMQSYLTKWREVAIGQGKDVPTVIANILLNIDEFQDFVKKMNDADTDTLVNRVLDALGTTMVVSSDTVSILVGTIRSSSDDTAVRRAQLELNLVYSEGTHEDQVIETLKDTLQQNMSNQVVCIRLLGTLSFIISVGNTVPNGDEAIITKCIPIVSMAISLLNSDNVSVVRAASIFLDFFTTNNPDVLIEGRVTEKVIQALIKNNDEAKMDTEVYSSLSTIIRDLSMKDDKYMKIWIDAGVVPAITQGIRACKGITADKPNYIDAGGALASLHSTLAVLNYSEDGSSLPVVAVGGAPAAAPAAAAANTYPDFKGLINILKSPTDSSKDKLLTFIVELKQLYTQIQTKLEALTLERGQQEDKIATIQGNVNKANAELEKANATNNMLQGQITQMKAVVAHNTANGQQASDSLNLLQKKYDLDVSELQEAIAEKQRLLDIARNEQSGINKQNNALNMQITEMQMKIDSLNAACTPLQAALDGANNELSKAASVNNDLTTSLAEEVTKRAAAEVLAEQKGGADDPNAVCQPYIVQNEVENKGLRDIIEYLKSYNVSTSVDQEYLKSLEAQVAQLQGNYDTCKKEKYALQRAAIQSPTVGGGRGKAKTPKKKPATHKAKELREIKKDLKKANEEYAGQAEKADQAVGRLNLIELAMRFTDMMHKKRGEA